MTKTIYAYDNTAIIVMPGEPAIYRVGNILRKTVLSAVG